MLFGKKIPLSKDILNIAASGLVIYCMVFLRIAILVPLLSVEVLLLHVLTMPTTSSSVTGLKTCFAYFCCQGDHELKYHLMEDLFLQLIIFLYLQRKY